jgi:hypothetical protein
VVFLEAKKVLEGREIQIKLKEEVANKPIGPQGN